MDPPTLHSRAALNDSTHHGVHNSPPPAKTAHSGRRPAPEPSPAGRPTLYRKPFTHGRNPAAATSKAPGGPPDGRRASGVGLLGSGLHANIRSMIVAVLLPRFSLLVALAGERRALLGKPVALAPELGRAQYIGETSPVAEVHGVRAGMRLGEAMARCPKLALVPPDPAGAAEAWERVLAALESIGAAVEPGAPGAVCFDAPACSGCTAGSRACWARSGARSSGRRGWRPRPRASPRWRRPRARGRASRSSCRPAGRPRRPRARPLRRGRAALPRTAARGPARAGRARGGAGRAARAAGDPHAGRAREAAAGQGRGPVRRHRDHGVGARARRGRRAPAAPADAAAARAAGPPGVLHGPGARARAGPARRPPAGPARAARAHDPGRRPRGDAGRGRHLARAGGVPRGAGRPRPHAARAHPAPGRPARAGRGAAPSSSSASAPPRPISRSLLEDCVAVRARRLREAVRQARVAAGPEAALRVLAVEPGSRVPERRAVLTPFQ